MNVNDFLLSALMVLRHDSCVIYRLFWVLLLLLFLLFRLNWRRQNVVDTDVDEHDELAYGLVVLVDEGNCAIVEVFE